MPRNAPHPPPFAGPEFAALCAELELMSGRLEDGLDWPGPQFGRLATGGVLGWVIPEEDGGSGLSSPELMRGYERLAAACLLTTGRKGARNEWHCRLVSLQL